MASPRHKKAATIMLAPGKAPSMAIATTVSFPATRVKVRATDHQQAPAIVTVRAAAVIGLCPRRRQVTTAIQANTTAVAT
jgi:hypothetical protein